MTTAAIALEKLQNVMGFEKQDREAIEEVKEILRNLQLTAVAMDETCYSDDPVKLKSLLSQRDKWIVDNGHWHDFTQSIRSETNGQK